MRFVIPFAYRASYLYRRHRKVQEAILRSEVEVEIEEVEPAGGPAFVLSHHRNVGLMGHPWRPFEKHHHSRPTKAWRVGEDLFVEYCRIDDLARRLREPSGNPFTVTTRAGATALPFGLNDEFYATTFADMATKGMLRRWEDDGGSARSELVAQRASALRIIDGHVCVLVNDPLIVVGRPTGVGDYSISIVQGIAAMSDGFELEEEFEPIRRFRLEGLGEAIEFCHLHGFRTFSEVTIEKYPEDRWFFPQEGEHLRQEADELVRTIYDRKGWLPPKFQGPLIELRAAVTECPPRHVVPRLEPALECFLELLASTHPLVGHSIGWEASEKTRFVAQVEEAALQAAAALRAWRSRPASADEWCGEAVPVARWRSVHQVLSQYELIRVAREMRIDPPRLAEARKRGLHLLHGKDETVGPFVALLADDLIVQTVLGLYGHSLDGRSNAALEAFLTENAKRSRDHELLASVFV